MEISISVSPEQRLRRLPYSPSKLANCKNPSTALFSPRELCFAIHPFPADGSPHQIPDHRHVVLSAARLPLRIRLVRARIKESLMGRDKPDGTVHGHRTGAFGSLDKAGDAQLVGPVGAPLKHHAADAAAAVVDAGAAPANYYEQVSQRPG